MATHGHGTTMTWNSQSVGSLDAIGGLSITSDSIEVTNHDSSDYYKEYIQGLLDAGSFPFSGQFKYDDTNGQIAMLTDMNNRTSRAVVITGPGSIFTWSFTGFLTNYTIGVADQTGAIPFSGEMKITGKPTLGTTAVTGMSACGFSNAALIMPTFAIGTYSYVVTITNGQTSTVITPVDDTEGEVITITAPDLTTQTVATGVASSAIAIESDEENVITITITKTGYTPKTYTFRCAVLDA